MAAQTSPPSVDEIERLAAEVQRDPGSAAFVALGEAYLALGRPRDAIEVGARGLKADPGNLAGRLMVSRAFAMLHKWKEAQAELLKVVKADRHNRDGFRLLGEVLLRRADYDRALPVLQHAQNLDPGNADVLHMLKRAREGRPLDPPPPIPTPREPARGRRPRPSRPPPPPRSPLDDEPTRVADPAMAAGRDDATETDVAPAPPAGALGRMPIEKVAVRVAAEAPRERGVRRSDDRGNEAAEYRVQHHAPPPPENPLAPLGDDADAVRERLPLAANPTEQVPQPPAARQPPRASQPPPAPGAPPAVRPRILEAGVKPDRGQAREALRRSAAVGEDYLNQLLTHGLLDVPNVRVPPQQYEVRPDKLWGRSTRRMFIALFGLLIVGVGAFTGYYVYDQKRTAEAVAAHVARARQAICAGTYRGLRAGLEEALAALKKDRGNPDATAAFAHLGAVDLLLYGEPQADTVERALTTAAPAVQPGTPAHRDLAVARAALALHALDQVGEGEDAGAETKLADARAAVDAALADAPDDPELIWLRGVAADKAGKWRAALADYERASAGDCPLAARVARADLLLDAGEYDAAFGLFDEVLTKADDHPWGYVGRSLARSERYSEAVEAVDDINVGLSDDAGPKVAAWKALALVSTHRQLEDYEEMGKALASATGIDAPRFLARVALAQLDLGRVEAALKARRRIRWAGAEPDRYPLVAALDAELLLASGLADAAVANVDGIDAPVVRKVRGRALFDAGKYEDALAELDKAATLAPGDPEVAMWREAARYVVGGRARRDADQALTKLGLQAKAKDAKTVHGLALRIAGRADAARRRFEQSLEDVSDEYPNALAYRAHVELARMALDGGALEAAEKHLKAALDQNPTYLPARALMGRTLLALGDPNAALEQLVDVIGANVATAADELAFAEALVAGSPSDEDRGQARQALERAAKKGASAEEIARVAALVDPDAAAPDKRRRRRR